MTDRSDFVPPRESDPGTLATGDRVIFTTALFSCEVRMPDCRIVNEGPRIYVCQNRLDGNHPPSGILLGYRCAWQLGLSSDAETVIKINPVCPESGD